MLDEIIRLADHIINESGCGVKCVGVEAVSLRTGEVRWDFFGDYVFPNFVDGKLTHEKCEPTQAAFKNYPLEMWSVTFHGVTWARQHKLMYMLEELDKYEERAAELQEAADSATDETKKRAELHADFAFGIAYKNVKKCADMYQRYTNYAIGENTALRAIAQRKIDYSLIRE